MKHWFFAAMAVGALLACGMPAVVPALAASPAPTPVPRAMPDFSSMRFLMGTWNCHSMVRGRPRPDTSTTTMTLDGEYMVTHDVAPPFDRFRNRAVNTDTYVTYNPINHMWVSLSVDNFGGYGVGMSPGWRGNTLTTTIKMAQDGTTGSDTLTKVSDRQTSDVSTTTNSGHMTRVHTMCTKTS